MTYTFRKAVRAPTTVLVALAGPSGSGKTVSGLRLAIGLARGWRNERAVMIDSEHRRGTHHADMYDYDYLELKPPFSTEAYQEAVLAADAAGYGAIFVDSFSHNWNGEGGLQDVHDEEITRLIRGDTSKIEALDGLAWKAAKLPYKKMIGRFTRLDAHIVFGLRAEDKIKYIREGNKTKVEHVGFQPICEKGFMFEVLTSFLLSPETPGLPNHPMKIDGRHKPYFPPGELITEESGARLAKWARAQSAERAQSTTPAATGSRPLGESASGGVAGTDASIDRTPLLNELKALVEKYYGGADDQAKAKRQAMLIDLFHLTPPFRWPAIEALSIDQLRAGVTTLRQRHESAA